MPRLLVHVEGQTEETFVNELLRDHLVSCGFDSVSARIVGNNRLRSRRGGIRPWPSVRQDIVRHLRDDQSCLATTLVDYYGLPATDDGAWPGREVANGEPFRNKAKIMEQAILADVAKAMGDDFDAKRFVPFVIMHEFEGLLFSDCAAFARAIGQPDNADRFQEIRDRFDTPEEINDSPTTAPSKRILSLVSGYQKPLFGNLAALEIGLDRIRDECPLFDQWLSNLAGFAA